MNYFELKRNTLESIKLESSALNISEDRIVFGGANLQPPCIHVSGGVSDINLNEDLKLGKLTAEFEIFVTAKSSLTEEEAHDYVMARIFHLYGVLSNKNYKVSSPSPVLALDSKTGKLTDADKTTYSFYATKKFSLE